MLGSLILYLKGHEENDGSNFLASTVDPFKGTPGFRSSAVLEVEELNLLSPESRQVVFAWQSR